MDTNAVKKEIIEWIKSIVFAVILGFFIVTFVCQSTIVYGQSMEPTLHEGNMLLVEKITPRLKKLSRGDIIVLQSHVRKEALIKRVVALEGDTVEIKDGKVFVNGAELNESYINGNRTDGNLKEEVPQGKVFVLGDNRNPGASLDSRSFDSIDIKDVEGRALVRYYPFGEAGLFKKK